MTAIVTLDFRHNNLEEAVRRMDAIDDIYYLAVGKSTPWDDDNSPPTPTITPKTEIAARLGCHSFKRVADYEIVAPRHNWTNGDTYVAFDDDDAVLGTKAYYALVESTFRVYLCLKAGSGASTVQPTGIDDNPSYGGTTSVAGSSTPQALADGYVWKYLYTIDAVTANKFLTNDFMPVLRNDDVSTNAVAGGIYRIDVLTGGVGYDSAPTVTVEGDGTGATATAVISGGAVTAINMTAFGSGYSTAKVTLSGGTPETAATARAIVSTPSGSRGIDDVNVSNGGTGYANGSMDLLVEGDGEGASVTATVSGGVIQASPTINDPGYGYTWAKITPDGTTAGTEAVLSPEFTADPGGFGYDVYRDMNAYYLMCSVDLEGPDGDDFIPANDYRQIMLFKNPLSYASPKVAWTATTGSGLQFLDVDSGGTWVNDDVVTGGSSGSKAYVDWYDSANQRLYIHQDSITGFGTFTDGEALTGDGLSTGDIAAAGGSADNPPEVDKLSGHLVYLENRAPVSRAVDQTESIRLVIQF